MILSGAMRMLLPPLILLFGLTCCIIAVLHILFGLSWVPDAGDFTATLDSEDRFYAAMFFGFGAAAIWCSRDIPARRNVLGFLMSIFFLGGIARLFSLAAHGWPHPLFIALGAIELVLPPIVWWWSGLVAEGAQTSA